MNRKSRARFTKTNGRSAREIEHLLRLVAEQESIRFSVLFEKATSRSEVVCTFLALLELIRLKQLVCSQPETFGEIEISRNRTAQPSVQAGETRSVGEDGPNAPVAHPQS